jgi:uncharacterized RDD family membrane protein YckC
MYKFLKKNAAKMNFLALILMLVIPFALYIAAIQDSLLLVKSFLGLFILNMLFIMKNG